MKEIIAKFIGREPARYTYRILELIASDPATEWIKDAETKTIIYRKGQKNETV